VTFSNGSTWESASPTQHVCHTPPQQGVSSAKRRPSRDVASESCHHGRPKDCFVAMSKLLGSSLRCDLFNKQLGAVSMSLFRCCFAAASSGNSLFRRRNDHHQSVAKTVRDIDVASSMQQQQLVSMSNGLIKAFVGLMNCLTAANGTAIRQHPARTDRMKFMQQKAKL